MYDIKKEIISDAAMGRLYGEILNTGDDGSVFTDGPIYVEDGSQLVEEHQDRFNEIFDEVEAELDTFVEFVINDRDEMVEEQTMKKKYTQEELDEAVFQARCGAMIEVFHEENVVKNG